MTDREFDKILRNRAKEEECPMPEELNQKLDELLEKLPNLCRRRITRVTARILLTAAILVVLLASATALSPSLQELLKGAMGGFAPYAQEVEGISATDQEIQIRVVSSVADEQQGIVTLEVKDLTGKRLEEGMNLAHYSCLSFDQETSTAVVRARYQINHVLGGDTIDRSRHSDNPTKTLKIREIFPTARLEFSNVGIPWDKISKQVLDSYILTEEECQQSVEDKTVLKPNQTPMKLEGTDLITISSMGYDSKGSLHVQFAVADGFQYLEYSSPVLTNALWEKTDYLYRQDGMQWFELEDGKYVDWSFQNIEGYKLEDILPKAIFGYVRRSQPIRGNWELTFPLKVQPERSVTMRESVGTKHMTIEQMTFSILGMRLEGTTVGKSGTFGNMEVRVYHADGSFYLLPDYAPGSWSTLGEGRGRFTNEWSYEDPIEPEQVTGVSIGYWMIPITGHTGGPGYWLKELPQ